MIKHGVVNCIENKAFYKRVPAEVIGLNPMT